MPTIQKHHIYKIYSNGVYKGQLPNVISDFEYVQDINTAGVYLNIKVALTIDTIKDPIEALLDESGNTITDESNNPIYIDRQPDVVGLSGQSTLIKNGNNIVVTEISDYYPSGKVVLRGKINRWEANFNEKNRDTVNILVFSDGDEFDNYIVQDSI